MRKAAGLLVAGFLLTSCHGPSPVPHSLSGTPAVPARTPSVSPGSSTPAADPSRVVQERKVDAAGDLLTVDVLPLGRTPDGAVVFTARVSLDSAADGSSSALVTDHFSAIVAGSFDQVRLVDTAGRRVYLVAASQDDGCACSGPTRISVGSSDVLRAVFTGVPPDISNLSVMLPYAGVFVDVPVEAVGAYPGGIGAAGSSYSADLEAYSTRRDVSITTRTSAAGTDLDLDTDVLFRLDSAVLTPAAGKTLAAAGDAIMRAGAGPLTITGFTDSTGTAAHNQTLSEARARAVAAALRSRLPIARWPQTVSGKGETQPLVPNDTADHRRRNRRVTIAFKPAHPPTAAPPASVPLPPTTGVTGTGAAGVDVALPIGQGTVRLTAAAAVVRGPFVQVDLIATNTGTTDATILTYLGQGVFTVRDELDPSAPYGASGVRAFTSDSTVYAVDYLAADNGHRCLCDQQLDQSFPPGSARTISLWYPAPGPSTKTLTLDVPDRFRLTGIPITVI